MTLLLLIFNFHYYYASCVYILAFLFKKYNLKKSFKNKNKMYINFI